MSSSSSSTPTASASAAPATLQAPSNLKAVGIVLAIVSGLLIGSSFVFKKKGLLRSQANSKAGEGVAYLKSPLWWTGMIMMILGELCNFAAYAFVEALVVTPLGALSVVICAILSSIFLQEKLTFFGWLGCGLCIVGSVIIALNGPQEPTVGTIKAFQKLFLAPGFLVYAGTLIAISLVIIFYFAPKYGKTSMLWYIAVCSMIGGISVSVTTGLGSAIVTTAMGENQFKYWFIYFLIVFVVCTLLTEVYYLNVALALFNTAMVTPTYYVLFSFCSMVTTVVLFQGLKASAAQILTVVMAFMVICCGITILQMSKVDPTQLKRLDRRSTILLQAARQQTEKIDEKDLSAMEDPGIDAIRGSFGPVGSIIRARSARRLSRSGRGGTSFREGRGFSGDSDSLHYGGMQRHQLYDAPVPDLEAGSDRASTINSTVPPTPLPKTPKTPTIKFGTQETVHKYDPGRKAGSTTERRDVDELSHVHSPPPNMRSPRLAPVDENSTTLIFSGLSEESSGGLRTAPAGLGLGLSPSGQDLQLPSDPKAFGDSPATVTSSSFATWGSAPGSGPKYPRDNSNSPNRKPSAKLPKSPKSPSRHGRSASGSARHYPAGSADDDREESMSLVRPSESDTGSTGDEDEDEVSQPGIRLVPQQPYPPRF